MTPDLEKLTVPGAAGDSSRNSSPGKLPPKERSTPNCPGPAPTVSEPLIEYIERRTIRKVKSVKEETSLSPTQASQPLGVYVPPMEKDALYCSSSPFTTALACASECEVVTAPPEVSSARASSEPSKWVG